MTSFLQFGDQPPTPAGVVPIPKGELRMINIDPHHQQEKGLVPVPSLQGGIMWVHPDLVEANNGLLLPTENPKAKQKLRLAMWCVPIPEKQKPMSPY